MKKFNLYIRTRIHDKNQFKNCTYKFVLAYIINIQSNCTYIFAFILNIQSNCTSIFVFAYIINIQSNDTYLFVIINIQLKCTNFK